MRDIDGFLTERRTRNHRSLARQILRSRHPRSHKELEADGQWFDRKACPRWPMPAARHCRPEATRFGLGFLEVAFVLEEVGRTVAKVPYSPRSRWAYCPSHFGDDALQRAWIPRLVAGEAVATTSLVEDSAPAQSPATMPARRLEVGARRHQECVPAGLDGRSVGPAMTGTRKARCSRSRPIRPASKSSAKTPPRLPELAWCSRGHATCSATLPRCRDRVGSRSGDAAPRPRRSRVRSSAAITRTIRRHRAVRAPIATFQAVGQRAPMPTSTPKRCGDRAAGRGRSSATFRRGRGGHRQVWAADGGSGWYTPRNTCTGHGRRPRLPRPRYFLWAKHLELSSGEDPAAFALGRHPGRLDTEIPRILRGIRAYGYYGVVEILHSRRDARGA